MSKSMGRKIQRYPDKHLPKLIRLLERKRKKGIFQSLPLHKTFVILVEEWHKINPEGTQQNIADILEINRRHLSNLIHQTGQNSSSLHGPVPNWHMVLCLAHLCKRKIVITPEAITIESE
jgi:hypothetical protein